MSLASLTQAVADLAQATCGFTEVDLEQPWAWRKHADEGARFALLGSYHELCDLADTLAIERAAAGHPQTSAQRTLGHYLAAYWDLQAVLVGVNDEQFEREPAPGEWSLKTVVAHVGGSQRHFFTLVDYGLRRQRGDSELPDALPEGEVDRVTGPFDAYRAFTRTASQADLMADYAAFHERMLSELAGVTDAELDAPSPLWWEGEAYPLRYRLLRCDAHLRQHTVQAVKTLDALEVPQTEARQLIRLVYAGLAEVARVALGAGDVGVARVAELAAAIEARAGEVAVRVAATRAVIQAVQDGDIEALRDHLATDPAAASAIGADKVPVVMGALYRGHTDMVAVLVDAGAALSIFEAAALGRADVVEREVGEWPGWVNESAGDGFTPLQLACYFGQTDTALWLIDHNADVNAVSGNAMRLQPIHAAAAGSGDRVAIVSALLAKGADVNARQSGGYTALHTAADNDDVALARLLLDHGADAGATTDDGRTAADVARAKGSAGVVGLLR